MEADRAIDELQLKTGELQSIVEELKQQPDEFDIDDSVQGTNAVFNQLSVVIAVACLSVSCMNITVFIFLLEYSIFMLRRMLSMMPPTFWEKH